MFIQKSSEAAKKEEAKSFPNWHVKRNTDDVAVSWHRVRNWKRPVDMDAFVKISRRKEKVVFFFGFLIGQELFLRIKRKTHVSAFLFPGGGWPVVARRPVYLCRRRKWLFIFFCVPFKNEWTRSRRIDDATESEISSKIHFQNLGHVFHVTSASSSASTCSCS